jgi:hypothetical protein
VVSGQRSGEAFVVSGESVEAGCPGEAAFDHPASGQQHEASLGLRMLDHFQPYAVAGGGLFCGLARIALIDISKLHVLLGDPLYLGGELLDLGPILLIGCGHMQRQQVSERVHRRMHLGALAAFRAIVAGPRSRLRRGLDRADCPASSPSAWRCARRTRAAASADLPPATRTLRPGSIAASVDTRPATAADRAA